MSLNLDKSNWHHVALGDLAAASKETVDPASGEVDRFVAGEHMDSGELRIRRWGDVGGGYLGPAFHRRFHPGQVLYGSRRTYLRKVAVADFGGVTANTTFVVETKDALVLRQDFLPFVMSSERFHAFAIQESKGSVNPYVNWSDIERYEFDLPPRDAQKRLAALLWAVERHREALVPLGSAGPAARFPHMSAVTGVEKKVGDVVEIARSGATPLRSNKDFYGGAIPWLKSGEVTGDWISTTEETITEEAVAGSAVWLAPAGAVVVAMYGDGKTRGQVGRIAIPMTTNQAVIALVPDQSKCDPDFLYFWLRSRQVELRNKGAGAVQRNLSKALVVSEPFPDLTVEEQLIAVRSVMALDAGMSTIELELRALAAVRASLLVEIFGDAE